MEVKVEVSRHRSFKAELSPLKIEASERSGHIMVIGDVPSMSSIISVRKEQLPALKALLEELERFWASEGEPSK